MSTAPDRKSLESKLPEILDHLGDYVARLKEGRVDRQDLVITRRLTRPLEEYRVKTPSAMALEQFESVGLTIHPGQKVGYQLRDSELTSGEERILPAPSLSFAYRPCCFSGLASYPIITPEGEDKTLVLHILFEPFFAIKRNGKVFVLGLSMKPSILYSDEPEILKWSLLFSR
jgi:hypothetical protein